MENEGSMGNDKKTNWSIFWQLTQHFDQFLMNVFRLKFNRFLKGILF